MHDDLTFDRPGIGLTMVQRTLRQSAHAQEMSHFRARRVHDLAFIPRCGSGRDNAGARHSCKDLVECVRYNERRVPSIEGLAAFVQNVPLPTRELRCPGASARLRGRLGRARSPSVVRHRAIECTELDTCLHTQRGRVTETTGSDDAIGDSS